MQLELFTFFNNNFSYWADTEEVKFIIMENEL